MLSLYDYNFAYIFVKETIAITGDRAIFKNCAPFSDYIGKTSNTQIDNAKYIDVIIPMYSDNYSETSGSLWKYCRYELTDAIVNSESLKSEIKITGKTPADDNTKDV